MTRGGQGKPVPIEALEAVATVYKHQRGISTRRGMARELGITTNTLHVRLQQIRQRTGRRSTLDACNDLLYAPGRYELPMSQRAAESIERRAALRRAGSSLRAIAEAEGVSQQAISEHFRRHPL